MEKQKRKKDDLKTSDRGTIGDDDEDDVKFDLESETESNLDLDQNDESRDLLSFGSDFNNNNKTNDVNLDSLKMNLSQKSTNSNILPNPINCDQNVNDEKKKDKIPVSYRKGLSI